jgi:TRAP-type C4-dicarboxylate transport system permease small subunit
MNLELKGGSYMGRKKAYGDRSKGFLNTVKDVSSVLNIIAGVALTFLMCLTIADVILRSFRRPIVGTYELVMFSGAVVIAFSLPLTSWVRQHIFVDTLIIMLPQKVRDIFNIVTRCLVMALFLLIGWNMLRYGHTLQNSGEVSPTLQMPFYPIAYGVGVCLFILCLVFVCDIIKISGGEYDV